MNDLTSVIGKSFFGIGGSTLAIALPWVEHVERGLRIAGVAIAITDRQKILSGQTDRWTGTMAHAAETERAHRNPGYNSIQVREIQKQYQQ